MLRFEKSGPAMAGVAGPSDTPVYDLDQRKSVTEKHLRHMAHREREANRSLTKVELYYYLTTPRYWNLKQQTYRIENKPSCLPKELTSPENSHKSRHL